MIPLLTEQQIREGVARLAARIAGDYAGRPLAIIGVLTGSVVLLADVIRLIDLPLRVGLVQTRSYRGAATTPGPLVIHAELLPDLHGFDTLLLDDIFDTGHTLSTLVTQFQSLGCKSIRTAVLLRKVGRQQVDYEPDYVAFEIPDKFVVGYGLDYQDAYRHLPYIAVLEPEDFPPEATS
jgi:hypoxanthine phosphoribosyltransferase